MQHYTVYFWKTALHVSGGISTHHQEHTQLYLQYLALVNRYCYISLLWVSWKWFECGVGIVPICFGAAALCRILQSMQHTQDDTKERELLKCVVALKECIRGGGRHL